MAPFGCTRLKSEPSKLPLANANAYKPAETTTKTSPPKTLRCHFGVAAAKQKGRRQPMLNTLERVSPSVCRIARRSILLGPTVSSSLLMKETYLSMLRYRYFDGAHSRGCYALGPFLQALRRACNELRATCESVCACASVCVPMNDLLQHPTVFRTRPLVARARRCSLRARARVHLGSL